MKKGLYITICVALFGLCSCSTTKDFHRYNAENSYRVRADFDQTWEEVIDYVAECNYEITNLEKESGIITIRPCKFKAAFQIKGRQDYNYYYSVQYYPKYKDKKLYVISNWNIRVKPINHWITEISVNLLDNGEVIMIEDNKKETVLDLANQSTGRFEKMTLYSILDNLRETSVEEFDWKNYRGESN